MNRSESLAIQKSLHQKLSPARFPNMSRLMAAIVAHVIDARYVSPAITEIVVTSDGFVLIGVEGDVGANQFVGCYQDLFRNWLGLLRVAGLTLQERSTVECAFAGKIGYFGQFVGGHDEN